MTFTKYLVLISEKQNSIMKRIAASTADEEAKKFIRNAVLDEFGVLTRELFRLERETFGDLIDKLRGPK